MKKALLAALALSLAGCFVTVEAPPVADLSGFRVTLQGVFLAESNAPAPVVPSCAANYGGSDSAVPPAVRGTPDCRYAISNGDLDFRVMVQALDRTGNNITTLTQPRPVSFRVLPGDLALDYFFRTGNITNQATLFQVRANHLFGETRVWVEDSAPLPLFDGAGAEVPGRPDETTLEFPRTFVTGLSKSIYFEEPTLAKLQQVDIADNRSSPFVGQFVSVGRPPTAGPQIVQSCAGDPDRDGLEVAMVVTGIDGSGFYLTDINSCRIPEVLTTSDPVMPLPEPTGFLPGTYGSIYVYNYSHPDGLDVGDLLFAVTGSMQEFTSTTQLTFAAWNIKEKVRMQADPSLWNKWLDQVPVNDITLRTCGLGAPYITDTLCANSRRNLKMESLESTLVRISHAKLPTAYAACDRNADGKVEFFCDYRDDFTGERLWGQCPFGPPSGPAAEETQCYIDCTNSLGQYQQTVCTERTAYSNFGQLTVELAGIGPEEAGLDESIGQIATLSTTAAAVRSTAFQAGQQLNAFCDAPVHYKLGDATVTATTGDPLLAASTLAQPFLQIGATSLSLLSADPAVTATCKLGVNRRTRLLTVLKDVAPDLVVECSPSNPDAAAAEQCRFLQGATYDIVGHLRQVQPARPRWMLIPRDLEDVCCHPGAGLQCPAPIEPCLP
ncbi:MAG: hypothetical protein M3Y59_24590 [Myxococcota bacterium]|nr:hypothetical protein [Myxococcota bacterium]